MKKLTAIVLSLLMLCACGTGWEKYTAYYTGSFDVTVSLIAFSRSEAVFNEAAQAVFEVIERDGKLFDIYNSYEGMNNLKTINDSAGTVPVAADEEIIELLTLAARAHEMTKGLVNAAMGPVLRVWHEYRERGLADEASASLPPMSLLREKSQMTDINDVIVDRQAGTVFLKKPGMSLDVGALAKGFTAQRAMLAAKEAGLESFLLNMGGNVVSCGRPMDGRSRWAVGVQNPDGENEGQTLADTVYVNDRALVSSGDYQRYYTVDGVRYNHIIDPRTLMPAVRFAHVTVMHQDSGMADALSTALFLLPLEEGRALLEEAGAEGIWIGLDGSVSATDGYAAVSQKLGGESAWDK